jgi:hypothetical protein
VVLTVRKGWEPAWTKLVETGHFGSTLLGPDHPYLDIAAQIALYDSKNYPGIPPANPGGGPLPDNGHHAATQSTDKLLQNLNANVIIKVESSEGFLVGYTAIIDSYTTGHQENQEIISIPDITHITVKRLSFNHDGSSGVPIPIRQAGEKGQLIAEWFEYTPMSGTDIAVTSNLESIA